MVAKVLIVDDSQVERSRLEKLLQGSGYTTVSAENGVKALEMVEKSIPDLILMDVNMPEMDGFAATRALRNKPEAKHIPVILVTSKNQKADKAWGKMLGAKGYVTKPYTDDEVLSVIQSL